MDDSVITCNGVIESYGDEGNLNKKSILYNAKVLYPTCIFINYYSTIDSC